jgi:NAD(P)-dependent dehydrogenase (short-subunit alcohol dehydrogenase family)
MAGRSILITGCSSGIGHCAAHGLKDRGWQVFAGVRKEADRARLAAEGLDALIADYDDEPTLAAAVDHVLARTDGRLDALFNNGGYAQPGALEDLSTADLRAQFESNFFGWHELTRRVIPVMRRQGSGRIVNCASILGFVAAPFRGAYVASKFALEGLSDTLRLELRGSGIHVIIIEPGPIRSRFAEHGRDRARTTIDVAASAHRAAYEEELRQMEHGAQAGDRFRLGPEAVLTKLVQALDSPHPRARYRVTLPSHAAALMKRLLPTGLLDRILANAR